MPTLPAGTKTQDLSQAAEQISLRERLSNAVRALRGERPFGPGEPISPIISSDSVVAPRQYIYPSGVNMQSAPRKEYSSGHSLASFDQLRNLAALYDVAALAIAARIEEIQGMRWSVVAKNKRDQNALRDVCEFSEEFWGMPDALNSFDAWMGMVLYDLFTIDAVSLYKRRTRGGDLYGLDPVDGSTIKPLIDERGRTVAYQQIVYGQPETEFQRNSERMSDMVYSPAELQYRPRWTRSFTPYGFPPTEWIILRVNTALRKQAFDLRWFTDGNIPDMIATPPDQNLPPDQVREFEDWFNAVLEGDDAARRKIRFIPWNMNMHTMKEFIADTKMDEWMLRITCAAYAVPPQELGFTMDVNRASGEMQEAINERRGLRPLAEWLKSEIIDPNIRALDPNASNAKLNRSISYRNRPTQAQKSPFAMVEWQWSYGDKVDDLIQAQTHGLDIQNGVITEDESRTIRYGDILDGQAPGRQQAWPADQQAWPVDRRADSAQLYEQDMAASGGAAVKFFQGGY